jgi:uncharacterized protein (TIGR01777 family)
MNRAALEEVDAVVHLAGENIVGKWTPEKKDRIRNSRVLGTRLLATSMADVASPPKVFVSASAIGYYGDRGIETIKDDSPPRALGFLTSFTQQWERAAQAAEEKGIRVVIPRIGFVLGTGGGGLPKMLKPFRMGLGGRIGDGLQYVSWITIDDLVSSITFALNNEDLQGPYNATAPNPVTNGDFAKALGRVLGKPAILPTPAFVARWLFGQMADEALLASAKVIPQKLLDAGFKFLHPELEEALRILLTERE